jgi:hypothetical protein
VSYCSLLVLTLTPEHRRPSTLLNRMGFELVRLQRFQLPPVELHLNLRLPSHTTGEWMAVLDRRGARYRTMWFRLRSFIWFSLNLTPLDDVNKSRSR